MQSNSKKHFISISYPPPPTSSINWGDETNIDMAVDIPTNTLVANMLLPHIQTRDNNISTPHVQTGGSNVSMP